MKLESRQNMAPAVFIPTAACFFLCVEPANGMFILMLPNSKSICIRGMCSTTEFSSTNSSLGENSGRTSGESESGDGKVEGAGWGGSRCRRSRIDSQLCVMSTDETLNLRAKTAELGSPPRWYSSRFFRAVRRDMRGKVNWETKTSSRISSTEAMARECDVMVAGVVEGWAILWNVTRCMEKLPNTPLDRCR